MKTDFREIKEEKTVYHVKNVNKYIKVQNPNRTAVVLIKFGLIGS